MQGFFDPRAAQELYPDFDIQVLQQDRGVRIDLRNAPAMAFVDGEIIRGVAELLFAVVRDLAFTAIELGPEYSAELDTSAGITDAVFRLLRNARILQPADPNLVVCWGGHSIGREEYLYTKQVGYELGLRGLDICTGCGPGAMKGPMKGATIAHAKQRRRRMRYIGITEPGIIAAESPNPIVNHLVIMPDIEKRLEAFVRMGHGIIVFPGGVGTAEEILYLLGILLREENAKLPFPLILTGPAASAPYFEQIDKFLRLTLGEAATSGGGAGEGMAGGVTGEVEEGSADVPDDITPRRQRLLRILGDAAKVEDAWRDHLTRGRKGAVENSLHNALLIVRNDRKVLPRTRLNLLTQTPEVDGEPIDDTVTDAVRIAVETRHAVTISQDTAAGAVRMAAELDAYQPVREYLLGLRWDGVRRLPTLARAWFGATGKLDDRFVECFLVGAVRRAFRPGCQHRTVLTLVGDQNVGKSSFFEVLGGRWYNASKIEVANKDGVMIVHSAWMHEFPECEQLTLYRDAAPVKAFLTLTHDIYRPPYARSTQTVFRASIFGATTNDELFLRDESGTGSSRWHPIAVRSMISKPEMIALRDQVLAEAFALARPRLQHPSDQRAYLTREEEVLREESTACFRQVDPWDAKLGRWLALSPRVVLRARLQRYAVAAADILGGALDLRDPGVGDARRLAGLMKRRGWEHSKQRFTIGGETVRRLGAPEWCYLAPVGWRPDGEAPDDDGDELPDDHPAALPH